MQAGGVTVYVADDHRFYRERFVDAVEQAPGTVVAGTSASGHEALQALVASPPDVAILAHRLPGIGGIEIAQSLADAGLPTRIVVVAGVADAAIVECALDAGASAVVGREDVTRHLPALLEGVRRGATVVRDPRPGTDNTARAIAPHTGNVHEADAREHRDGVRRVALLRAGAGLAVAALAVAAPDALESGFWPVYAVAMAWMFVGTALLLRPAGPALTCAIAVGDGIAMFALIETSGDATSSIRLLLLLGPLCYAPFVSSRTLVWLTLAGASAYIGAIAFDDLDGAAREAAFEWLLTFVLVAVFAVMSARLNERRLTELRALSQGRQRLLGQLLGTEFRERRRLSQDLHDEALQLLLAARQDLEEAAAHGDRDRLVLAQHSLTEGIRRLRETVHDLHPIALDHGGLDIALHAICDRQARLGGFVAQIAVAPESVGIHDELLVSLARELVTNAAKHARAERLHVTVRVSDGMITLAVVDDGCGIPPGRPAAALDAGHIGLASCIERVEAAGGTVEIDSEVGGGTAIRINVPVDLDERAVA